tara:strand:- start:321 stop:812 length:492 start_codon:yes stop_codon:yes gene_type:complete
MKLLSSQQIKIVNIFTSWRFVFFLIWKLPMGFVAGLRVKDLDKKQCVVTVPYNYLNKNPFSSMYFAVQSMAAELSTGALMLLHKNDRNISVLVTNLESNYYKKGVTKIQFICSEGDNIANALKIAEETGEAQKCVMISKGYDMSGVCVSEFRITWSLKKRKQP